MGGITEEVKGQSETGGRVAGGGRERPVKFWDRGEEGGMVVVAGEGRGVVAEWVVEWGVVGVGR